MALWRYENVSRVPHVSLVGAAGGEEGILVEFKEIDGVKAGRGEGQAAAAQVVKGVEDAMKKDLYVFQVFELRV